MTSDSGILVNKEKLMALISASFDDGELRILCTALNISFDNIPGRAKNEKVSELILYCERRDLFPALFEEV